MQKLLNDEIAQQVKEVFDTQLKHPVRILFFGKEQDCDHCTETRQLAEEVTALSEHLSLETHSLEQDAALARQYGVSMAPGLVIAGLDGDKVIDYGVRFAGIPSGYEFSSLIQDLILVSGRDSGLAPTTRQALQSLKAPLHLQVFVTPTCPYCPQAVILAHQMAMENPLIQAEMVEAMEFPELSQQNNVSGVPQTTINHGAAHVVGAVPEEHLLQQIQQILQPAS